MEKEKEKGGEGEAGGRRKETYVVEPPKSETQISTPFRGCD
jgi:hypothetical protein